jgi:hypothetical protein
MMTGHLLAGAERGDCEGDDDRHMTGIPSRVPI